MWCNFCWNICNRARKRISDTASLQITSMFLKKVKHLTAVHLYIQATLNIMYMASLSYKWKSLKWTGLLPTYSWTSLVNEKKRFWSFWSRVGLVWANEAQQGWMLFSVQSALFGFSKNPANKHWDDFYTSWLTRDNQETWFKLTIAILLHFSPQNYASMHKLILVRLKICSRRAPNMLKTT